jgi:hypothetical protein
MSIGKVAHFLWEGKSSNLAITFFHMEFCFQLSHFVMKEIVKHKSFINYNTDSLKSVQNLYPEDCW